MQNNMPELNNPMMNLMLGNMPGLPDVIQNAMPYELPRPNFNQNPLSLILTGWKIRKLDEMQERTARIAENAHRAVKAKFDTILEVITYSAKTNDAISQYKHNETMRTLEVQEKQAQIYLLKAQAQSAGYEAKQSELDYNVKFEQMKEMLNGSSKA